MQDCAFKLLIYNSLPFGFIMETTVAQATTMKTIIAALLIITTLESSANFEPHSFGNDIKLQRSTATLVMPSMMQGFTVITLHEKTILNWSISENESARIFEVQRSSNGTDFKVIGIVMTSERSGEERYEFKEKSTGTDSYYRIRLVNSNQQELFSEVKSVNSASDLVAQATRK